jgi:hypothetical protein
VRLDLSARGLPTFADVVHLTNHDIADPNRIVADVLGPDASVLSQSTPYQFVNAQALVIQYQQVLNGQPAHGELLVAAAPNVAGVLAIDVREAGEAPADTNDVSWRRINSVALLVSAGLELPAP